MTAILLGCTATIAFLLLPAAACGQAPTAASALRGGGTRFQQLEAHRMGRLMALDTDGDGRISRVEFMAGSTSGKGDLARRFALLDANGDGFVDRGEIDAMLKRRFDRMDTDHDGTVTPAERATAHERRPPSDDNG